MIKIENLTRKFGSFIAVDNLSFEVFPNEIFGLLGPNGAGKTTTISMICGLIPPTSGTIGIHSPNGSDKKSYIGYCPQENIFYPRLTCLEQLIFTARTYDIPAKAAKTRTLELLEQLGLQDKSDALASKLSGGMKRRLNIALAIIHNPEILILDEPEAGLDPQSRILVRDFIQSFSKQKTVILTTHNMDEADRLSHRVAIMDYGKLLALDTSQKLKKMIGDGNILEISSESSDENVLAFVEHLKTLSLKVKTAEHSVMIQHPDVLELLPQIKNIAEGLNLQMSEIKLRENTLEDVFIHLTGRNLRQ